MSLEEQVEAAKKQSTISRAIKLLIKIGITILCFWYISTRIDFSRAFAAFKQCNWFLLFIALLFFILSKIFSAFRLNINFRNIYFHLLDTTNLWLYLMV